MPYYIYCKTDNFELFMIYIHKCRFKLRQEVSYDKIYMYSSHAIYYEAVWFKITG